MSWPFNSRPQNPVCLAPFDMGRGVSACVESGQPQAGHGGPQAASEASLGNLRNRYAGDQPAPHVDHGKTTEKPDFETGAKTVSKADRRADRFALQQAAARLTPSLRVSGCLWAMSGQTVSLLLRGGDARFSGLQTCGSVWSCPCCSARISETRRNELRTLEEWAGSPLRGLRLVMMTLTARHRKRALGDLVDRMAKAKRRMQNLTAWKRLRESGVLFGSVSVREATYSDANGWHPHYHVLCLVRADSDEEAVALLEPQRRKWLHCLRKEGLTGTLDRAFDLQNGDAVAAYISKHGRDEGEKKAAQERRSTWGIAEEMTLARVKKGRGEKGRSPWQILRDAAAGDAESVKLWQEYALTMHGRRQQVWSDGLKAACGLIEVEDEEAAEGEEYTEELDELLMEWQRQGWLDVRPLRAQILAAAEAGGLEAVQDLLKRRPKQKLTMEPWAEEVELIEAEEPAQTQDAPDFDDLGVLMHVVGDGERPHPDRAVLMFEADLEADQRRAAHRPAREKCGPWLPPMHGPKPQSLAQAALSAMLARRKHVDNGQMPDSGAGADRVLSTQRNLE